MEYAEPGKFMFLLNFMINTGKQLVCISMSMSIFR